MPSDSKILGEILISPTSSPKMTTLPITASLAFFASSLGSTWWPMNHENWESVLLSITCGGPGPPRRIMIALCWQLQNLDLKTLTWIFRNLSSTCSERTDLRRILGGTYYCAHENLPHSFHDSWACNCRTHFFVLCRRRRLVVNFDLWVSCARSQNVLENNQLDLDMSLHDSTAELIFNIWFVYFRDRTEDKAL